MNGVTFAALPLGQVRESGRLLEQLRALTNEGNSLMRQWLLNAPVGFVVLAQRRADAIVGWSLAFRCGEDVRLCSPFMNCHVFVDRMWRRHHVGRALLRTTVAFGHMLRVTIHDEASERLYNDPEVWDRLYVTWMRSGSCRECGGHGIAASLVNGRLLRGPCGRRGCRSVCVDCD